MASKKSKPKKPTSSPAKKAAAKKAPAKKPANKKAPAKKPANKKPKPMVEAFAALGAFVDALRPMLPESATDEADALQAKIGALDNG